MTIMFTKTRTKCQTNAKTEKPYKTCRKPSKKLEKQQYTQCQHV